MTAGLSDVLVYREHTFTHVWHGMQAHASPLMCWTHLHHGNIYRRGHWMQQVPASPLT